VNEKWGDRQNGILYYQQMQLIENNAKIVILEFAMSQNPNSI